MTPQEDGKEYQEGKDYKISRKMADDEKIVVPLEPSNEDEFKKPIAIIENNELLWQEDAKGNYYVKMTKKEFINYVNSLPSSKFSITKR